MTLFAKLFRGKSKPDMCNNLKHNPTPKFDSIHKAAANGDEEDVKIHLLNGVSVDSTDDRGLTSLMWASYKGHLTVAKLLVEKGANMAAVDGDGFTPLRFAVTEGKLDVAEFLLSMGSDVNTRDQENVTPLFPAVTQVNINMVRCLVEHGADVNAKDIRNSTPLFYAAVRGSLELVKYLVDKGADVDVKSNDGVTPAILAQGKGYIDIATLLIAHKVANEKAIEDRKVPVAENKNTAEYDLRSNSIILTIDGATHNSQLRPDLKGSGMALAGVMHDLMSNGVFLPNDLLEEVTSILKQHGY